MSHWLCFYWTISFRTFKYSTGKYVGIIFINRVLWSFQSVVVKWLLEKYFIPQFRYLLLHGFFGLIVTRVDMQFSLYVPCTVGLFCSTGFLEPKWDTLSWMFSSSLTFNCAGLVVILCAYNVFQLTTIKLFTPTHNDASDSLGSLISWIYIDFIENTQKVDFIIPYRVIGYKFMIIASLMYNEIFIVYVFNEGFNTKKEITKRREEEGKADIEIDLVEMPFVELLN